MIASIIFVVFAFIAITADAQTACLPGKYCSTVAAKAGTYATAQACINACPAGSWASYATGGSGWCGCATSCDTQVTNPNYQTYCLGSPAPSFRPTANPTANPTYAPSTSTACLPGKFCSNVAAIAGRYETAQACVQACPAGTWASYATGGSGWCGCAAACDTQVSNPNYQTFCPGSAPPSFKPTATPTAKPTATPTLSPTALNKCAPGYYCSYNMVVYPAQIESASKCAWACSGQKFFTYVPSSQWCACAGVGQCDTSSRIPNTNADTYCL